MKRAVFAVLYDLKENNSSFSEINLNKLYQSFAWFDRLNNIDYHVAKYSQSISTNKWKPILRYLQIKPGNIFQGIRWLYYAKYLLHKLLALPIQLSPGEIIKKTNLSLATEENNEIMSITNSENYLLGGDCKSEEQNRIFQDYKESIKNKNTEINKINARMIEKLLFSMTAHQSSFAALLPEEIESFIDILLANYPAKLTPDFEVKYLLNKNALLPQAEIKDSKASVLGTKMQKGDVV
ncbi:MAG: hypothetical protein JSS07_07680 [Proteobacteria bacterium]|nr:hypothetical protein [Pseudomonadota bacterium]